MGKLIKDIKMVIRYIRTNYLLVISVLVATFLRLTNLGYSDYQGDEIKALYLPTDTDTFSSYLMDQRKGPVQFLITYILKFINPSYDNQFLIRLPFAIAGILSVYFFYKLVKNHFGDKIAFYSSMFLATNGFFIAFSRIVQYQSFVILFMILALYMFSLSVIDHRYKIKGIYLGFLFWATSILSHYDGIFIFGFASYLFITWIKNADLEKNVKIKTIIGSLLLSGILLASFYIPFVLSISQDTVAYWSGRISGDVSSKISSSRYLFTVYQPIYVVHIYTALFALGTLFLVIGHTARFQSIVQKFPTYLKKIFNPTTKLMVQVKEEKYLMLSLFLWIGIPLVFMELFVYIPGTHIYAYMIPMFVILAYGLITLESLVERIFELKLVNIYNTVGISVLFVFIILQSYAVFVENKSEYPWNDEKFMFWTFSKPTPIYHLSMFGFPYYRNWEGIRDFVKNLDIDAYSTNERKSIVRYYIPFDKGSDDAGVYVYVRNPQSFENEILNEKPAYWVENYDPIFTFSRQGTDLVRVYLMEVGSLEEIIEKGY